MQKHVNFIDLVKSFPTNIYLQILASIQPRASLSKFVQFSHIYPAQRFNLHIGTTPGVDKATEQGAGVNRALLPIVVLALTGVWVM